MSHRQDSRQRHHQHGDDGDDESDSDDATHDGQEDLSEAA